MRILVLTPDFPPGRGGVQLLVGRLAANLSGDRVTVITLASPVRSHAEHAADAAVAARVLALPRIRRLGHRAHVLALNIVGLLAAVITRPDAVIAAHVVTVPAARAIASLLGKPYVLILHSQEIANRPSLVAAGVTHSAATVAVSSHAKAEAVRTGSPAERIVVVNPGVDLPASAPPLRDAGDASSARPTIVTIARMVDRYKGHDVMIDAITLLREDVPDLHWVVVGDGPLREFYEGEVTARGLADQITFAGVVSDAERDRLLETADVFAMPSRVPDGGGGEGFGLVFLEAAARGVPVVAGAEGGALDAVLHERTGLLVNPRDAVAVAAAILRLIESSDFAATLSASAREHARSRSWPAFAGAVREQLSRAAFERETSPPASAAAEGPTRVLALSHTAAFGGAERSLLAQLQSDSRDGAITALVVSPRGALAERSAETGIETADGPAFEHSFRVSPFRLPFVLFDLMRAGRRLAWIARREQAQIIHANSLRAGLIAVAARPFGAPPVITHVRDCMPESTVARAIGRLTRAASAHVVANSDYAARAYSRAAGGGQPSVVYNAIEPAWTADAPIEPQAIPGPNSGPVLSVVGQITPWKGQDVAIRALAQIKPRFPQARLVIAGSVKFSDGARYDNLAYETELKSLAAQLEISDDVIFLGELSDVRPLLAVSDIVLMPSWEEPFGRAAIEAMAAGRAVIATSIGGPEEFIDHGANGMLAEPRDVAAWSRAIETLLDDPALRRSIGERARIDALRRFSPGAPETRLLHIYERHASGRSSTRGARRSAVTPR